MPSGTGMTVSTPAQPIYAYSTDGFTFSTREFGTLENIDNKQKVSSLYGGTKVFGWAGYADEPKEANVKALIEQVSLDVPSVSPTMIYIFAIGEGLNLWIDNHYAPAPPHHVMIHMGIHGFYRLGLDDFVTEFARYKPFLPADFNEGDEFTRDQIKNENDDVYYTGDFKDLKSGLYAAAAVTAHRKSLFLNEAERLGYGTPNFEQTFFWTYVYFQGEGDAARYLEKNNGLDFSVPAPHEPGRKSPSRLIAVRKLALERLATWQYVKSRNLFSS